MRIELANCSKVLLDEINDKRFKRKDVIGTYRLALLSSEKIDWKEINEAIIKRWSLSGLYYIKNLAWKDIRKINKDGSKNEINRR